MITARIHTHNYMYSECNVFVESLRGPSTFFVQLTKLQPISCSHSSGILTVSGVPSKRKFRPSKLFSIDEVLGCFCSAPGPEKGFCGQWLFCVFIKKKKDPCLFSPGWALEWGSPCITAPQFIEADEESYPTRPWRKQIKHWAKISSPPWILSGRDEKHALCQ